MSGADVARSAVSCSLGARAGCFGPMPGLGLSCTAIGGKAVLFQVLIWPLWGEGRFVSAVAGRWDDVILRCTGQQGCGFRAPESNPQAWYSCCVGSRKHHAKRCCCRVSLLVLLHQVPIRECAFGTTKCSGSLRGGIYPRRSPNMTVAESPPCVLLAWRLLQAQE